MTASKTPHTNYSAAAGAVSDAASVTTGEGAGSSVALWVR